MIQQQLFPQPLTVATLREIGEAKKQCGMALAADKRADAVAAGQVAFLRALLASVDGTATLDDATGDLSQRFTDGGRWRGTVCRSLAVAKITEAVGVVKSDRPSRHRGYLTRWRLIDRSKAQREIEKLTAWLSVVEQKNPLSAATDAGNGIENLTTQTIKESSNETY